MTRKKTIRLAKMRKTRELVEKNLKKKIELRVRTRRGVM